jgi:hypothetical protein
MPTISRYSSGARRSHAACTDPIHREEIAAEAKAT